jgi:outer membrane receptor protein involved in Fe transport
VPAGDAAETLRSFSKQSGEQIIFPVEQVRGVKTRAVQGQWTPREALDQMLAGTSLVAVEDAKTGALTVRKGAADPNAPRVAPAMTRDAVTNPGATAHVDETVVLSPFEVSASLGKGYVGQDTLAGSRLRTDLKDLGAAISPMTAEFLSDIAATNIIDASEYGVGTRVDTDDARTIGPAGDTYNDSTRSIRIRGLPGGSRSMSFFGVSGEVDTYLTERIDVSRGPNSILYGFGSSAGQLNVSTKQASTNKNAYSLSSRIDSWGGQRWTVDANFVPWKNKLGFRAVVLRGREESWRAAGYNDQDRFFLSGKWQIDRKTTLKAEFEHGKIKSFTPRPFFGVDLKSTWDANGQPIFNNFNSSYTPGGAFTPGAAGTPGTPIRDTGTANVVGVQERNSGDHVVVSSTFPYAQNYRQFTISESPTTGGQQATDFAMGRRNPKAAMEANWVNSSVKTNNGSVVLQRELLRDFNAELAVNRQAYKSDTRNIAGWNHYGIAADTNRYLPNGQLRPAENLYYFELTPNHKITSSQVNQGRITLSYEKGLREWVTLRLAGLGEMASSKIRTPGVLQQYWFNGPEITSGGAFNVIPENAANTVYYRYYIKDLSVLNDPHFRIPVPYNLAGATFYQDPQTGAVRSIYMREIPFNNFSQTDRNTNAWMSVGQAYLLNKRLVVTYGYRKDRLKSWTGIGFRDPAAEAIALNRGTYLPGDPSTGTPDTKKGQTRTAGGVLHLTSWLSSFYNQSNCLSLPGTYRVSPSDYTSTDLPPLAPSPYGKTADYGIKLSLLKNRVFLTATKFHTVSKNEFGSSGFSAGKTNIVNIWNALANSTALGVDETAFARRQSSIMNSYAGYIQNSESYGYELEIVGQLLPGWSVSANYSKNVTQRSNIATEYRALLDHWKPYWLQYRDLSITQNTSQPRPQKAPGFQDWNSAAVIASTGDFTANTDSINEAIVDAEAAAYDNTHVFEGQRFVGDPLHSINLRTRYDFRRGLLKGFRVGGGVRLRYGRVGGAHADYTFAPGSDFTDAYNGRVTNRISMFNAANQIVNDAQFSYTRSVWENKVRWTVQLNVNNLTNQRELIVNNSNPRTLAPLTYRYQDPRQFILTNTFSF